MGREGIDMLDGCGLVIFDCDGVLVDSERIAVAAFVGVMRQHGVPATEAMVERFFGMKQADTLLAIAEETGRDIPLEVAEAVWPATRAAFERELRAMPGIEAFLAAMPPVKRCVASSSHPERIALSLALTGLTDTFGASVFSSHQVARGKPAPDLFLFAAVSMGVEPGRCVVIEDSRFGIEAARAAGMTAIGFTGGSHVPQGHAATLEAAGATLVEPSWEAMRQRLP